MNSFDAVVYIVAIVAVVMGFRSGLLRSLATIFGYVIAMPVAVLATPQVSLVLADQFKTSPAQAWAVFGGIFLLTGIVLGALLRFSIGEIIGPQISVPDRLAGSALGAVRIGLLAVLMVLIFDRIIPANRQPNFLVDSHLRPILSAAGQMGLRSLPPDVTEFIDRMKRSRGIR